MREESSVTGSNRPVATAWQAFRAVDLAVLCSVPILLVGVFALPASVRQSLVFEYTDPTLVTAVAAPFVHLSPGHLAVNVLAYFVVVPVAYVLSVASGRRARFFAAFGTFVLVFPALLSVLNLAVVRPTGGVGFSAVVMAFVGYLPLALADYLETRADVGPSETVAPLLFFLGMALVAGLSVQSVQRDRATVLLGTAGLVLTAILAALLYWLSAPDRASDVVRKVRGMAHRPGNAELLGFSGVVFVSFFFVAFPPAAADGATVVNVYVHLLGYALGFIATYATVEVAASLADGEPAI
jgi:membrane associated rhomboid family serine protease